MAQNISEAVHRIRVAGPDNVRRIPGNDPQSFTIQINENGQWVSVVKDVSQTVAEDVMRQATNRVILG